ncbi:UDP-N-acetylmuramate dehydrogenase [Schleiferilactobacillus shenzhenensis]|uniref:UDP-N-acetylenolpyruvoylglucosamine reductase n=1 Tax=Schleiferilactobacillus shenzhenensis LY-73 TaxID=1231336 RepID=U4TS25_9LACO|nr:UDP-N-acetylmuramate dehydrogenase [Schleiferilactobacillus shenzhenensis]ERL66250.1 MurB [Schleiferilactobacillus shenzhenensis LY-73]
MLVDVDFSDVLTDAGFAPLRDEPLSKYTFTKTGGRADWLIFPRTHQETMQLVQLAQHHGIPLTIVGNASNLIVRDGGIRGLVLILTKMDQIRVEGTDIVAEAGARIIDVAETAYRAGLSGLEFAAGIPGSVGGAIFMNAGAYGGQIDEVAAAITYLDRAGHQHRAAGADLHFSYRHSLIQENEGIVLTARFHLVRGIKADIRAKMDHFNALRAAKQPLEYPSCGSVFKRPVGHYTGPLIIKAGLQGKQIGGAQVSKKHAGFIVNIDHATASDYLALIQLIQQTVWADFGVRLEPEVRIIGEAPEEDQD